MNEDIFLSGLLLVQVSNVLRSPDAATVRNCFWGEQWFGDLNYAKKYLVLYFCSRFSVELEIELWVGSMGRAELRPRLNAGIFKKKFFLFLFMIQLRTHLSSLVIH